MLILAFIIKKNLYGIDLDDRAIQLAQIGLYIKAKIRNTSCSINKFNVVSTDFYLPEYEKVKYLFNNGRQLDKDYEDIVINIWEDLQMAYKFGSLIRIEENFNASMKKIEDELKDKAKYFNKSNNCRKYYNKSTKFMQ